MIFRSNNPLKRSVFGHLVVIIGTLLSLPLIPIIIVTLIIAYSFRHIIKTYVKLCRPEFGKILPLCGSLFSAEPPGKPCDNSIFHNFILKGSVDFSKLRNDILVKVNQKNAEGNLKYPELQQVGASFAGYSFWKWDKGFDIKNHVRLGYNGKTTLNIQTLNELTSKEMRQPYFGSPWEVFVFPHFEFSDNNNSEPKSAVIVRFNHVLLDGNTMVELLVGCANLPSPPRRSKNTDKNTCQRIASRAMNILLGPYQLIGLSWDTWDGRLLKTSNKGPLVVRFSEPIPMSLIKDIKNKLGVSFGGVLMAAYTGGLRKLMLENKISLPVALHSFIPMPMLGHQDKLRNRMKYGYVTMPVGINDPEKRLKVIESQQKVMAKSRLPSQMHYLELAMGIMPAKLMKTSLKFIPYSGMITNFLFPIKGLVYDGHSVENMFGTIGLFHGSTAISTTAVSFEGSIMIEATYVKSSLLEGNPDVFLNGILEELKILSDTANLKQSQGDIV